MIIHISHMLKDGISSITVKTIDTVVIVILLSFMVQFINIDEHVSIVVDLVVVIVGELYPSIVHSLNSEMLCAWVFRSSIH